MSLQNGHGHPSGINDSSGSNGVLEESMLNCSPNNGGSNVDLSNFNVSGSSDEESNPECFLAAARKFITRRPTQAPTQVRRLTPPTLPLHHEEASASAKGEFTLRIMYEEFQKILKMGLIGQELSMLPGFSFEITAKDREEERWANMRRYMAMMDSMTDEELDSSNPMLLLNEARILSIARGSGCEVGEVKAMLKMYKRLAKAFSKMEGLKYYETVDFSTLFRDVNAISMSRVLPPQMLQQIGGMGGLKRLMKQLAGMDIGPQKDDFA